MEGKLNLVELEERLASTQMQVIEKRSTIPKECAALISSNLKLQLKHTVSTVTSIVNLFILQKHIEEKRFTNFIIFIHIQN